MINYIKPTSDLAAKKLFQDPVASKGFLKTFLGIDAKKVTLLNTQSIHLKNNDSTVPFSTLVDVLVGLGDGTQVIVEINQQNKTVLLSEPLPMPASDRLNDSKNSKLYTLGKILTYTI